MVRRKFTLLAVVGIAILGATTVAADALIRADDHQPEEIVLSSGIVNAHSFEGVNIRNIEVDIDITPRRHFVDITYLVSATTKQAELRDRDALRVTLPRGTYAIGGEFADSQKETFRVGPRRIKEIPLPVTALTRLDKPLAVHRPFRPVMSTISGEGLRSMKVRSRVTARVPLEATRVERTGIGSKRIRMRWDPTVGPSLPINQINLTFHQVDAEIDTIHPTPRRTGENEMSLRISDDETNGVSVVLIDPLARIWVYASRWLLGPFLLGGLIVGLLTGWIEAHLVPSRPRR